MLSLKMKSLLHTFGLFCAGPRMHSNACWLAAVYKHDHNAFFASAALAVHCIHLPAQRGIVNLTDKCISFDIAACMVLFCACATLARLH